MGNNRHLHIRIGGRLISLDSPVVMAILNVTPDSFFSGSRLATAEDIRNRVGTALKQGAALLDIGGYSSRPGAADVSETEEISRVSSALEVIRSEFGDVPVSIDTFRSKVAEAAVSRFGSCIVNDISGGEADTQMYEVIGKYDLPYVVMHMRGTPRTMQEYCRYEKSVPETVLDYFVSKIDSLHKMGIYNLIIDPGFGFSKTTEQNFELLAGLHRFRIFDLPILAGISRKSMIYKTLNTTPENALNGTTALHTECLRQGANILRVHDTVEAVETITLYKQISRWTLSI